MKIENTLEKEVELAVALKVGNEEYNTVTIREVTGLDEEAVSQPIYKKNPIGLYHELVYRCITEVAGLDKPITKNYIKSLTIGTLDQLAYEIRKISVGDDYEYSEVCPECNTRNEGVINLADFIQVEKGNRTIDISLKRGILVNDKRIKDITLIYPTGQYQERAFKESASDLLNKKNDDFSIPKFGEITSSLVYSCISNKEELGITTDIVKSMSTIDRKDIAKKLQKTPGLKQIIEIPCNKCSNDKIKHTVNLIDFLL